MKQACNRLACTGAAFTDFAPFQGSGDGSSSILQGQHLVGDLKDQSTQKYKPSVK